MVARSTLRKSEYDLRDQLLQLVQSAESAYWDVIESRESLKVQEEYLKLNDVSLKRSQRELELGALSPLDIYRPQQQYAQAEIQVSRYRFQLAQREDVLRRQIGADLDPRDPQAAHRPHRDRAAARERGRGRSGSRGPESAGHAARPAERAAVAGPRRAEHQVRPPTPSGPTCR